MPNSPALLALDLAAPQPAARVLVIVPGKSGSVIAAELLPRLGNAICLDSSAERLKSTAGAARVRGQAARLPFARHAFDTVLAFEALYSIRPPWTVLAEFHRVLAPGGKLLLIEPARHGFFSALRDRVAGPGKRVYALEEIRRRLQRGDFEIHNTVQPQAFSGLPFPAWSVLAAKLEIAAEPAPAFHTALELIEKRKERAARP